jgi:hypothetical protein
MVASYFIKKKNPPEKDQKKASWVWLIYAVGTDGFIDFDQTQMPWFWLQNIVRWWITQKADSWHVQREGSIMFG